MVNTVASGACGLVLAASLLAHLRRPRLLARALAVHRVVPVGAWWPVAVAVVGAELATAPALLAAAVVAAPPLDQLAALAGAGLFAAFALYLGVVLRRAAPGAAVPCGCGLGETPVDKPAVARAAALAAVALVAAASSPGESLFARPAGEIAALAAAAAALALALALLPRSLSTGRRAANR